MAHAGQAFLLFLHLICMGIEGSEKGTGREGETVPVNFRFLVFEIVMLEF